MKHSVFEQVLACFVASTPSIWFMYNYLNIPTKLVSMFIFTAIIFSIVLTYVFNRRIKIALEFNLPPPRAFLLLVYIACILIILLSPSLSGSVFISLYPIGIVGWVRVAAGLLLGAALPGICIISLFRHKLNFTALLPISVLVSIFLNSIISFTAFMLGQSTLTWLLIANVFVVFLILVDALRDNIWGESFRCKRNVAIALDNEDVLMLLLCLFQLSIIVSVFFLSGLTVPNGDMWDHASMATRVEKGELLRFGYLTYPPLFAYHLFSIGQLTGIPVLNISNILGLLNLLLILAFYSLTLTLTGKKAVAFLSTFVFTVFGSFTFLVQALLGKMVTDPQKLAEYFLETAGKTMQINSVYPLANISAYAPVTLHFLSVIMLTNLLLHRGKARVLYVVEALLIANLFLLHVAETVYVFIFLLVAMILGLSTVKDTASLTLGVTFAGILFFVLPFVKSTITLYAVTFFVALLVLTLLVRRLKPVLKLQQSLKKLFILMSKGSIKAIIAFAVLSLYVVLFFIWKTVYIDSENTWYGVLSYLGSAPTYFMPIVFGIPMFLSVLYLVKILVSRNSLNMIKKNAIMFLAFAFLIAFLFGKLITFLTLSGQTIYRELRILQVFGGIFFSIISGYALNDLLKHFKWPKAISKPVLAVSLGILILLGSGSTLLSAVFWANRGMEAYQLNLQEIEALEFLKEVTTPSDVVLTYSEASNSKVGLAGVTTIMRYATPFRSFSPSVAKFFLQYVDYIYLTRQEYEIVQKSDTYMKCLVNMLPLFFNNSKIVIFRVPKAVKGFVANQSVPVIAINSLEGSLQKLAVLDCLGVRYRIYEKWDLSALESNRIAILTDDMQNCSLTDNLIDWVRSGSHLIVMSSENGVFSEMMKIRTTPATAIANGLSYGESKIPAGCEFSIAAPKESLNKDVQIVSWFTLNDQKVAPFIFTEEIGEGRLTFVGFDLPSKLVQTLMEYSKSFFEFIDPRLSKYLRTETEARDFPIEIYGSQILNGTINITSNMAYFNQLNNTVFFVELNNGTTLPLYTETLIAYSSDAFNILLNGSIIISPLHDEYVQVSILKCEEIEITSLYQGSENKITYASDGINEELYNITKLFINDSDVNFTFILKHVNITAIGQLRFEGGFFNIPYNEIIGQGAGPLTIKGTVSYNILFSDVSCARNFGDKLSLNGSYRYDYPTILEIELPINFCNNFGVLFVDLFLLSLYCIPVSLLLKKIK